PPFLLLVLAVTAKVLRTIRWMFVTGSPLHVSVPVAMIVLSGLLHAGFEDWLFAPGYYLCVFFWSLAFILVDIVPPKNVEARQAATSRRETEFHSYSPKPAT